MIHYLDDFLVMGSQTHRIVLQLWRSYWRCWSGLWQEKREGPATTLEFLDFEVDSRAKEIQLPARKLEELNALLQQWQGKKVAGLSGGEAGLCVPGGAARQNIPEETI